ncbi:MAG: UPF0175 family protein [Candidatus Kapabacteria bacterium]|nr:UPF0175 family protein [Candidatus Kapabacteria bacterium]
MKTAELEFPEDISNMLNLSEEEFLLELKTLAAIKYFELKKLSLGSCAKLANMSKADFINLLSKYKISIFNLSKEEINQDIYNA